jgi:hypothetical protein
MRMMNWKGFRRQLSCPNFKVLSRHLPGGTEENPEILSQDSRSPDQYLNSGPPERVLSTQPRISVKIKEIEPEINVDKNNNRK